MNRKQEVFLVLLGMLIGLLMGLSFMDITNSLLLALTSGAMVIFCIGIANVLMWLEKL